MEIFRRLGLADAVRNAGLPADYPNDMAQAMARHRSPTGFTLAAAVQPTRAAVAARAGANSIRPRPRPQRRR